MILVDDGLATGATMIAAVQGIRKLAPARATTPEPLVAVGFWYADFDQTTDEEVRELLESAEHRVRTSVSPDAVVARDA